MISEALVWLTYDKNNIPRLVIKVSHLQLTLTGSDRDAVANKNGIIGTD